MKHIVFYSGGIGSWATAKRIAERYGTTDLILLFTDTLVEDEDLYRFIDETAAEIGAQLVKISDGRTPFDVYFDEGYLGNSRYAPCSHQLKQDVARRWIEENFKPEECTLYLGIDWTEEHRTKAPTERWRPYTVNFPMCEEPYVDKADMLAALDRIGIKRPRLYDLGFAHNNCGGFCCRAGHGHFANLLNKLPDRFAHYEALEERFRVSTGKDVSMMKKERKVDGKRRSFPYTLRQLRQDIEAKAKIDMEDIGGCGCFADYNHVEDDGE